MTTDRRVRITLRPGSGSRVVVDGTDISKVVRAVDVRGDARSMPVVLLTLVPHQVDLDVDAQPEVPVDLMAALIALGWTPPGPDVSAGQTGPAG